MSSLKKYISVTIIMLCFISSTVPAFGGKHHGCLWCLCCCGCCGCCDGSDSDDEARRPLIAPTVKYCSLCFAPLTQEDIDVNDSDCFCRACIDFCNNPRINEDIFTPYYIQSPGVEPIDVRSQSRGVVVSSHTSPMARSIMPSIKSRCITTWFNPPEMDDPFTLARFETGRPPYNTDGIYRITREAVEPISNITLKARLLQRCMLGAIYCGLDTESLRRKIPSGATSISERDEFICTWTGIISDLGGYRPMLNRIRLKIDFDEGIDVPIRTAWRARLVNSAEVETVVSRIVDQSQLGYPAFRTRSEAERCLALFPPEIIAKLHIDIMEIKNELNMSVCFVVCEPPVLSAPAHGINRLAIEEVPHLVFSSPLPPLPVNTDLLDNGNFERWTNGETSPPDGWLITSGEVRRCVEPIRESACSLEAHGNVVRYRFEHPELLRGRTLVFKCWVYATINLPSRNTTIQIFDDLDVTNRRTFSTKHSGSSGWEQLTVTHRVCEIAGKVELFLYVSGETTTSYFSGATCILTD